MGGQGPLGLAERTEVPPNPRPGLARSRCTTKSCLLKAGRTQSCGVSPAPRPFPISSASSATGSRCFTGLGEHMKVPTSEPKLKGDRPLGAAPSCTLSLSRRTQAWSPLQILNQPNPKPKFPVGPFSPWDSRCPHLQWMTMGPASGGVEAFTRRMKASSPVAW